MLKKKTLDRWSPWAEWKRTYETRLGHNGTRHVEISTMKWISQQQNVFTQIFQLFSIFADPQNWKVFRAWQIEPQIQTSAASAKPKQPHKPQEDAWTGMPTLRCNQGTGKRKKRENFYKKTEMHFLRSCQKKQDTRWKRQKRKGETRQAKWGMKAALRAPGRGRNADKWEDVAVKWGADADNNGCLSSPLSISGVRAAQQNKTSCDCSCALRRAMAKACLAAQDTLTIASKLRSSPSPVIIHVFIDEKPPNSRPYPVIIHVHIDENPPSSSLSCCHR